MTNNKRFVIQKKNEKRISELFGIPKKSGIYLFYRINEDKEKCVYVGLAKNLLQRTAGHLSGKKTHIDKSLMVHGLFSQSNLDGWKIKVLEYCPIELLDVRERYYIDFYNNNEYKIYNVCGGGQIDKAKNIAERHEVKLKTYKNGKNKGYIQAKNEIREFFNKYLDYSIKGVSNKIKERKLGQFKEWLENDYRETDDTKSED